MFPYLGDYRDILPYNRIADYYKSIPKSRWLDQCSPLEAHSYEHRPDEEKRQAKYYNQSNAHMKYLIVSDKDFFPDNWFKIMGAKKQDYVAKIFHTTPGNFEPAHKDFFPSFLNNTNPEDGSPITEDNIKTVGKKIIRCWIPLTDSNVGHLLFSDDYCLSKWQRGDVFELPSGTTHGFVNAGRSDRYLLVFTAWRDND